MTCSSYSVVINRLKCSCAKNAYKTNQHKTEHLDLLHHLEVQKHNMQHSDPGVQIKTWWVQQTKPVSTFSHRLQTLLITSNLCSIVEINKKKWHHIPAKTQVSFWILDKWTENTVRLIFSCFSIYFDPGLHSAALKV